MRLTRKTPILAAASLLALAACTDTMTGERDRTGTGALIGAGVGALAGATKESGSDRTKNAIVGALIGGAVGAGVGSVLDAQAEELRGSLDSDIGVINTGSELIVRMPQDILFAVDSATVNPALRSDLQVLAGSLNRYPNSTITVVGHTDNTGTASYNQSLSEARASAVSAVLINAGVSASRIRAIGAGEDQPIATNQTAEGRALNRRVDITIRPN